MEIFYKQEVNKVQMFIILIFLGAILNSCSENKSEEKSKILAIVDDRVITVSEYIERAELTPRQPYCSSNTPRDKAIVLNTLIAEKILAIEVQDDPYLVDNERFQSYLQGRKEQYMRDLFFNDIAYNAVNLDTAEIVNAFEFAGREYEVEFQVLDRSESEKIQKRFNGNPAEKDFIMKDSGLTERRPRKKITWNDQETLDIVHSALFIEPHRINDVIGPLQTGYDEYLLMKIVDWKDSKTFGGTQSLERWNDVKTKLTKIKANKIWTDYTNNLMKGKKIEFHRSTYLKVFELFESWISRTNESKNNNPSELTKEIENENFSHAFSDRQFLQSPFCIIDQQTWTVADLKRVVRSHPLVLRKTEINTREELLKQFKLGIADLIRDQYITQEAYAKGYDKKESTGRYVQKWQDAYTAVYHRDKFLKKVSQKSDFNSARMRGSNSYFSIYLDSLITNYNDRIAINQLLFEGLKLTSVPMYAVQHNRPFVLATPTFPLLTDSDKLNFKYIVP
jgi:hypothetical protein